MTTHATKSPLVTTIIDGLSEATAVKEMHRYAAMLRTRRVTGRYGVYMEPNGHSDHTVGKLYRVCLVDRHRYL